MTRIMDDFLLKFNPLFASKGLILNLIYKREFDSWSWVLEIWRGKEKLFRVFGSLNEIIPEGIIFLEDYCAKEIGNETRRIHRVI